jgi:hypothetical protein
MVNLRRGAGALAHWARARRSSFRAATRIDAAQTRRILMGERQDLDDLAKAVNRDGVTAVPDYWSADRCAAGRAEIDRLIGQYPEAVQMYSHGSDKRMYGVESTSPLLMDFHSDSFPRRFGELVGGLDLYNFATLGARIEATSNNSGSGDGWHRDAHGFQFKAILYLSDTGFDNGPFQYLVGSHKLWRAGVDAALGDLPSPPQTRFSNEEIAKLSTRLGIEQRAFPARAGTLLLVNASGIHRGMPLKAGQRLALTNYYYHGCEVDEARIDKFSPLMPGTAERIRKDLFD